MYFKTTVWVLVFSITFTLNGYSKLDPLASDSYIVYNCAEFLPLNPWIPELVMFCFHVAISLASLINQVHRPAFQICFSAYSNQSSLPCTSQTDPLACLLFSNLCAVVHAMDSLGPPFFYTSAFRCPWRYGWFHVWDRKYKSLPLNVTSALEAGLIAS